MKFAIIVFFSFNNYSPIPVIFDTFEACYSFQNSVKRIAQTDPKLTPRQIYLRGHTDTPYFIPCFPVID